MAPEATTPEAAQQVVKNEREQLANALDVLQAELRKATDIRSKLPRAAMFATGALVATVVLSGGLGARRRRRERRGQNDEPKDMTGPVRILAYIEPDEGRKRR